MSDKLIKLFLELSKALFSEQNLEKALEIGEEIEEFSKRESLLLKKVKESLISYVLEVDLDKYPTSSIKTIVSNIHWFKSMFGYTIDDIKKIVLRLPQVLAFDIEKNLQLKLNYFIGELKFDFEEIKNFIYHNPGILSYSFKNRILPRVRYLKSKGIEIKSMSQLYSWLYSNDEKFVERLKKLNSEASISEYLEFK